MKTRPLSTVLCSSLCFTCLFLVAWPPAYAQDTDPVPPRPPAGKSFRLGPGSVVVPPPAANLGEIGPKYRVAMQNAVPSGNRLIAVYLLPQDSENLRIGLPTTLSQYALVETLRLTEFTEVTPANFTVLCRDMAQQFGTVFDNSLKDPEVQINNKLKEIKGGLGSLPLGNTIPLGEFFSKTDACSFGVVSPASVAGTPVRMVTGFTALRVRNRLIYTYLNSTYNNDSTIQEVRKTSDEWADAILAANNKTEQ